MGSHTFKGTASAISSIVHRMSLDIRCNIDIAPDVSRVIQSSIDIATNVHIAPSCLLTCTTATKNANVKSCPYLGKTGLKVSRCNKKAIVLDAAENQQGPGDQRSPSKPSSHNFSTNCKHVLCSLATNVRHCGRHGTS